MLQQNLKIVIEVHVDLLYKIIVLKIWLNFAFKILNLPT